MSLPHALRSGACRCDEKVVPSVVNDGACSTAGRHEYGIQQFQRLSPDTVAHTQTYMPGTECKGVHKGQLQTTSKDTCDHSACAHTKPVVT